MREQGIASAAALEGERQFEAALRPTKLADFTGQPKLKENLAIAIEAAKKRGEAMDHVLLYGPPGLGKTTLAIIIAAELGVGFEQTSGPILQKKLDLTGVLTNIRPRQVFFIDEIHRLLPDVEEILYAALEDFRMDILVGTGPGARTHSLPIPHFTAIGATTRQGLVSAPLRGRFGLVLRLNHYDVPELTAIALRSAKLLGVTVDPDGAEEIARRSRGTPRIANRLLRRVRDYAQVRAAGHIDLAVATSALDLLEVDRFGLDEIDQKIIAWHADDQQHPQLGHPAHLPQGQPERDIMFQHGIAKDDVEAARLEAAQIMGIGLKDAATCDLARWRDIDAHAFLRRSERRQHQQRVGAGYGADLQYRSAGALGPADRIEA